MRNRDGRYPYLFAHDNRPGFLVDDNPCQGIGDHFQTFQLSHEIDHPLTVAVRDLHLHLSGVKRTCQRRTEMAVDRRTHP